MKKDYFKDGVRDWDYSRILGPNQVEELYQAFKERLITELKLFSDKKVADTLPLTKKG